jgi:hypothetical protein
VEKRKKVREKNGKKVRRKKENGKGGVHENWREKTGKIRKTHGGRGRTEEKT